MFNFCMTCLSFGANIFFKTQSAPLVAFTVKIRKPVWDSPVFLEILVEIFVLASPTL
jgi:hypothetical protein